MKILVADDEEALLEVFSAVVGDMGHEVLAASDGEDALRLAREHRPQLIISDHMMPRRTGLELLHAVRTDPELAGTPFLLVSAARVRGADAASRVLRKPVALEQFEAVVSELLAAAPAPASPPAHGALSGSELSALSLAREELLNWVSHELKTPLSSAKMNAQLVHRHLVATGDASHTERSAFVLRQLDRMDTLVSSVLEAAQLADGHVVLRREKHDVGALVRSVVASWREAHPELEFELALPAAAVEAALDAERVRHVLDNLISNAVKYGAPSKRIVVDVQGSPEAAVVTVTDFGPGIEADELPRIFRRFHRGKNAAGSGHGLGLYIASALADLHGGSLRAHSETGRGATFVFTLPRST